MAMGSNITLLVIIASALVACRDDLRIKTVGGALPDMDAFAIESPANIATKDGYTASWTVAPSVKAYDVVVSRSQDCKDEVLSKKEVEANSWVLDSLADGQYYI